MLLVSRTINKAGISMSISGSHAVERNMLSSCKFRVFFFFFGGRSSDRSWPKTIDAINRITYIVGNLFALCNMFCFVFFFHDRGSFPSTLNIRSCFDVLFLLLLLLVLNLLFSHFAYCICCINQHPLRLLLSCCCRSC